MVNLPHPPDFSPKVGGGLVIGFVIAFFMMFFAIGGFNAIGTANQQSLKGNLSAGFNVTNNYHGADNGRGPFSLPQIFGALFPVIIIIYVFRRRNKG